MAKQNSLETKQISLTLPLKWYQELAKLSTTYGITVQDIIKQQLGEYLNLLPSKNKTEA